MKLNPIAPLGHYLLGETLGTGSFGHVKAGIETQTGQQVAIKILRSSKSSQASQEAKIGKTLHHPSIINVYESFEEGDWTCIVMEKINGIDLFDKIGEYKNGIPEAVLKPIFYQVIEGISYAHEHNVVHLDVKPENILLSEDCEAKIIDWGFGRQIEPNEKINQYVGSFQYCCPEILRGLPYDGKKADCWSLGVTLYVCLTGLFPWLGSNNVEIRTNILRGKFDIGSMEQLSREARDLISKLLKVTPSVRLDINGILKHPWFSSLSNNQNSSMSPTLSSP